MRPELSWRGLLWGAAVAVSIVTCVPREGGAAPSPIARPGLIAEGAPGAPAAPGKTPEAPGAFTSAAHGYRIDLPTAWVALPRRGAEDLADVRFRHENPTLAGFYQVYEGSVTDRADRWYENARTRYESAAQAMKQIERLTFSDMETTTMGGQKAYSFGFVTEFKEGPPVATRIVFTPRRTGERIDIHEIVVTGAASAFAEGQAAVDALLGAVRFTK